MQDEFNVISREILNLFIFTDQQSWASFEVKAISEILVEEK